MFDKILPKFASKASYDFAEKAPSQMFDNSPLITPKNL